MRWILLTLLALTVACGGSETESTDTDTTTTGDESAESAEETAPTEESSGPLVEGSECQPGECPDGLRCNGGEGCDVPWTCQPNVGCTRDLVIYCSCNGETVDGSGSCPPEPYAHRGPCE